MLLMDSVTAAGEFCLRTSPIWQFVGYILLIFKIVIPLLLLILGMVDLGKAVVASDDKAIQKSAKSLGFRAAAAVIIFFIPTLIGFVFSIVDGFSKVEKQYDVCKECLVSPTGEKCKTMAEQYQ